MKIHKNQNEIRLTNKVRTAVAVVLSIVYPLLWIGAVIDVCDYETGQVEWYDIMILALLLMFYLWWLFTKFRTDLRYEICFNEEGIFEKRYIGKEKKILWERFSEYKCEVVPSHYKSGMKFFQVEFISNDARDQTVIKTASFPKKKLHYFNGDVFPFCDTFMRPHERCRRIQESKKNGTVKIKIPRRDIGDRLPTPIPPRARINRGDGTTLWKGRRGQTAIFVIEEPVDITVYMGGFVYPLSSRVEPGRNYSCVQDMSGPHWKAVYRLCDDDVVSLIDLMKRKGQ